MSLGDMLLSLQLTRVKEAKNRGLTNSEAKLNSAVYARNLFNFLLSKNVN